MRHVSAPSGALVRRCFIAHESERTPISVLVWSDYACPFCHIARDRVRWLRERGATVEWLPFDLHPEYPDEGIERAALGLGPDSAHERTMRRLALECDLPYAPHPRRVPRTRRALELAEWARGVGGDAAHALLHERLMDARWAEGVDLTDWDELERLADEVGLDGAEGRAAVEGGLMRESVDRSTLAAHRSGIAAVPAFVFNEELLVSGAVPYEMLQTALDRVASSGEG